MESDGVQCGTVWSGVGSVGKRGELWVVGWERGRGGGGGAGGAGEEQLTPLLGCGVTLALKYEIRVNDTYHK